MNPAEKSPEFGALLDYLFRTRGFDFAGYKRSTLMRRITKRMQMVGIPSFNHYMDYLEVHPEEFAHLFNTILINVTAFFRDGPSWEYLVREILPRIFGAKKAGESIRVWSAGCASGEEAYTLAIVLCEALGGEEFRERVKIYATDADEEALTQARQASYAAKDLEGIPPALIQKYFEAAGGRHIFRDEIRRSVIFGRHDLVQDAPISRLDLLVCRNTLMYLNSETQGRILARFHFALNEGGFLFLGKAELLLTHANLFAPANLKYRIFSKVPGVNLRDRLMVMAQAGDIDSTNHLARQVRLREVAFDSAPVAQAVVDANGILVTANERIRSLLGLNVKDIGRPLQDLEFSYRPVELRSLIEQAYAERRVVSVNTIKRFLASGEVEYLDLQVAPLEHEGGTLLGVNIIFHDVSQPQVLQEQLQRSNLELETAYEELQSTNEELETTNEELQSTNEELETTNEELQSANEELETMNEELQSANEELQTVNEQLRQRTEEFNRVNEWLQAVLAILPAGLVVVDRNFAVLLWNRGAEGLWGLRAEEVLGRSVLSLDIGLPLDQLRGPIQACLGREVAQQTLVLDATNRRGKAIKCQVTFTLFLNAAGEAVGVTMLMEDETGHERAIEGLGEGERRLLGLLQNIPVMAAALDQAEAIVFWNRECERVTGYTAAEIAGSADIQRILREHMWERQVTCKDGSVKPIAWSSMSALVPIAGWAEWAIGVEVKEGGN